MSEIRNHLIEIERFYSEKKIPILNLLQDGINDVVIFKTLNAVGIKNSDLLDLYSWRNGLKDFGKNLINELEFFPEAIMLSLESAMTYYTIYTKTEKIWKPSLFPVFTSGGGDFYLVSTEKEHRCPVYLYSPSILQSEIPEIIYRSLDNLLECVLNCFVQGAYTYNHSEQCFEVNYDLREEICKKSNPNIAYWKS